MFKQCSRASFLPEEDTVFGEMSDRAAHGAESARMDDANGDGVGMVS